MIELYHPAFTHEDWIDNQDRVQAGGAKGLNVRFHGLETEFHRLADDHLNKVIQLLVKSQTVLSLCPLLTFNQPGSGVGWEISLDLAQRPATAPDVHGIMNVVLPDGASITSLTVFGDVHAEDPSKPVPSPDVYLRSKDMTGAGAVEIVRYKTFGVPAKPAAETIVDNAANKYFLAADLVGAQNRGDVRLQCFQIAYE
ncbi:hypothetical protein AB0442_35830 [Kitasatospora sp. NPDC085895]|uniref:hypothetical protein n=1 Tax=Kitasatospora sp. NPDC085895 TaxID=3155057 RepID=UPI00344D509E